MTTIVPLPRTLGGALSLPGASDLTLMDYDFTTMSAIPSGVTVSGTGGGTGAMNGTAPTAALRLSTGPSSGNQAQFALPSVDTTLYEYILFRVNMAATASYPAQIYFAMEASTNQGATWRRTESSLNSRNSDVATVGGPLVGAVGRTTRGIYSLLIIPSKKIAATMHGNGVINAAIFPNMLGGQLLPKVVIQTNSAVVNVLDVSRATVQVGVR